MTDNEHLIDIKDRVEKGLYLANVAQDLRFLIGLIEQLQKKNEVVSQHNLELTQEMENMRSDFGHNR